MISEIDREVKRLSKMDFKGRKEITVREEFIRPLLNALGYYMGTEYDINREYEHLLHKKFLYIGRDNIRIDYKLMVRKKGFWIIEAKSAKQWIKEKDICQAHLYAIHPEVNARFFAVINGWEIRVYDSRKWTEDYKPILEFKSKDLPKNFEALNDILGAKNILKTLKNRILEDIEDVSSTEVLEERLNEFLDDVKLILNRARSQVKENRIHVYKNKSVEYDNKYKEIIEEGTTDQIIKTAFSVSPSNNFNLVYEVFNNRFQELNNSEKVKVIEKIVQTIRGRPSTLHRLNLIRTLIKILSNYGNLSSTSNSYFSSIEDIIQNSVIDCLTHFENYPLQEQIWKLEGNLFRVIYKISFVFSDFKELFKKIINSKEKILTDEDLAFNKPHIAAERLKFVEIMVDKLYRHYSRFNNKELEKLNEELNNLDERINEKFQEVYRKCSDEELDLLFYYEYNKPFDHLNSKLYHILCNNFKDIINIINKDILELTEGLLIRRSKLYALNYADNFLFRYLYYHKLYEILCKVSKDDLKQLDTLFYNNYPQFKENEFKLIGKINQDEYWSITGIFNVKDKKLKILKLNKN